MKKLYKFKTIKSFDWSSKHLQIYLQKNCTHLFEHVVNVGEIDSWVWRHAVGSYLPEQDPEGPHVWFGAEGVVRQSFGSGPLDGELRPCMGSVSVVAHQTSETEVGHLHEVIITNEAVPSCQVPFKINFLIKIYLHANG